MSGLEGRTQVGGEEYPPEWAAILARKRAENGLLYRPLKCSACGYFHGDEAVLIGTARWKCKRCKYPNERIINRVGEEQAAPGFTERQDALLNDAFLARHGKVGDAP